MPAKKTSSPPQPAPAGKPPRKRVDWEAVERDYRTSQFTLRELAKKHSVTHTTIGRRAEREGWTKDLSEAIRQATNAKLIEATVQQECTSAHQNATEAVLGAAELNKQVILGQRSRVGRAVEVSMRMLEELDATTTEQASIKALFDTVTAGAGLDGPDLARAQQQLNDLLRLHSRVGSAQKLMDALAKAQAMEAVAFNLAPAGDPNKPKAPQSVYEEDDDELLAEILAERAARRAA